MVFNFIQDKYIIIQSLGLPPHLSKKMINVKEMYDFITHLSI